MTDAYLASKEAHMVDMLMDKELDADELVELDFNGDGQVSEFEYVMAMLVKTKSCEKENIEMIRARYLYIITFLIKLYYQFLTNFSPMGICCADFVNWTTTDLEQLTGMISSYVIYDYDFFQYLASAPGVE